MTRRKRKPRPCAAPTMVLIKTTNIDVLERLSVDAFAGGWATTDHFDDLADCHDLLNLAAADKRDQAMLAVCELSGIALLNVKDRYAETGRFGVTGEEQKALQLLAATSKDFWSRQSGTFFHSTWTALQKMRCYQREKREQEKAA